MDLVNISPEEIAAAQQQMLEEKNNSNPNNDAAAEAARVAASETARLAAEEAARNSASSLTEAEKAAETARLAAEEAAKKALENTTPVKSFEEHIAEKTAGKFNKWEDVEKVINAPKEEFADENIKHWNELAKKGIKLDKEFFDIQALDVDSMIDPEKIVLETMRRKPENKGLSDTTLRVELNKKYNYDEWIEKEDADLTEIDKANKEIMLRDAQNDLDWLKNFKKERTFIQQPTAEQLQLQADQKAAGIKSFEKFVDEELFAKIISLTTTIDETTKEAIEFKISEAGRKGIADLMKSMVVDGNAFFNQFTEKDSSGNLQMNDREIFKMIAKYKTYDEAVKSAYKDGMAVGSKNTTKEAKNISFKPADHPAGAGEPTTEAEAMALAIKGSGKSFS